MIKNFVYSIVAIFSILILFFSLLNFFLSGVPLFSIFKINISDAVYVLKDEKLKKKHEIFFDKEYYVDPCGHSENGFYNLAYKQDEFGFRNNNEDLFYNTDIVILGDSFGISSCINEPNDLTSKLNKKLRNNRILNISVGGTGPYYQKELLKELVKKKDTKFDTLIWLFYEGNDHEDLNLNYNKNINFEFKKKINEKKIEVDYKPNENLTILRLKIFFSNYLRGFGTLVKYIKKYPPLLEDEKIYDNTVKDLAFFMNEKEIKNKIIFYIPKYTRLAYKKINHPQLEQLNNLKDLVKKTAIKYDFKFIDGSLLFHNTKKPLDFFHYNLPTHFNIKGYDFMADQISKNLK